jgi:2-polyprenyl-6-methoxyphenol hydroxylase-like FAD-dependent oxidoreductase
LQPTNTRQHAIVIGGSLAGLLAARVLSDHFARVTIVERDRLNDTSEARKGVPQGRHFHVLLKRGESIVRDLFPSSADALIAGGATVVDIGNDMRIFQFGSYKVRCPTDARLLFLTRPYLEREIRRRVLARSNVAVLDRQEISGLLTDDLRTRVTGVVVREAGGGAEREATLLAGDLVIDASGRGSHTPAWLRALGYAPAPEESVTVNVGYTSRLYRRRPGDLPGMKAAYVLPRPPRERRFGALFPMEDDRWIATLGGWSGDHAPTDDVGFVRFAHSLPAPEIGALLPRLEPASDFAFHQFPANRWRHYEKHPRLPEGFLVLGDALCSFNPVYGQGITVAALEAVALLESLRRSAPDRLDDLGRAYFSRAAKIVAPAWMLTITEDFRHEGVTGRKRKGASLLEWYIGRVYAATARDPVVYRAFLRVLLLLDPPARLLEPSLAFRIMLGGRSQAAPSGAAGLVAPEGPE